MNISVVIPTYNSAETIKYTLDSVLSQTVIPDEILILDDGSTDETVSILEKYKQYIVLLQQENRGVAHSRNVLSQLACGDLIAYLDHDDIWHPNYLETRWKLLQKYPDAVAFFAAHVNIYGYDNHAWQNNGKLFRTTEFIEPIDFLKSYYKTTGKFGSMSFCCIPKWVLNKIGSEPFRVSGVDDSHLCTIFPLLGPVVYTSEPLIAYRITSGAQSVNKLRDMGLWIHVFEILEERYREQAPPLMKHIFKYLFASKKRQYAKLLLGAGKSREARRQLIQSLGKCYQPASLAKSLGLIAVSALPKVIQPRWPSSIRQATGISANTLKNGRGR
jgi:glycosyltransferase involved in cell wall biosynthesis